jgi:hypothetical protein
LSTNKQHSLLFIRVFAVMGLFKQLMIFGKTGLQGLPTRMTLFLWAFSRQGATGPGPPIHNMGFCSRLYLKEGTYHTRLFSPPPPNRTCPCRQELDIDDHTDPMCRHSRRGRTGRERPDVEADVDEGGLRLQAATDLAACVAAPQQHQPPPPATRRSPQGAGVKFRLFFLI